MAMTDMTIVARSMRVRLFSTITTVALVGVAVALLLVLLSMRESGRRAFMRGSGNMHLIVSRDASPLVSVLNGVFYADSPRAFLPWAKYESIAESYPFEFAIPTQLGDSYRGHPVMATTPEFFAAFTPVVDEPWRWEAGGAFDAPFEVVLGADVARAAGLETGDEIVLAHGRAGENEAHAHEGYHYEVVGVLAPTGSAHDRAIFTDLTSTWTIHAHDRRVRELGSDIELTTPEQIDESDKKITGIYARVLTRPGAASSAAVQQIFAMLRADGTITVASPSNQIDRLFEIVGYIDVILLAMAGVVLIAGAIAIMLALSSSMAQRRRQIAVLRVLGCSRRGVFGLVLTESAILGLLGAIAGVALAFAGAWGAAWGMEKTLGLVVEPRIGADLIVWAATGTVLLACVAGLTPAVMAYRTSVVKNLRPLA